jgi:hypothetical protein
MRGGKGLVGNSYENVSNSGGPSAWSYVNNLVGGLDNQYNNSLIGNTPGTNLVVGSRGTMSGGRRHRRHRRRGGSFAHAISNAVVPLGLLAAQQSYGKKSRKHRKSKKRKRSF